VNVLEVFEENNTAYIAMENISGCSLKYMLDIEGILPERKVLRYISQIAQALDFVHQKNILHLDIKPSNILIDKKNNARLIDFGVSKRYDIEQQETSTTMLTLSKGFAPIEQYDNEGTQNFSPCPDIYSLGATMYNLLTGEVPVESILRVAKPLVKPSEINKEITTQTENAILTAMQVNPIHRYQSVKAMINEIDIPSYFEDTPNLLIENTEFHSKIDKEVTELRSDVKSSQPVDEEQTAIRQTATPRQPVRTKKRKRRIWILLLIFVVGFIGLEVVYLFESNGTHDDIQHIANVKTDTEEFSFPVSEENTDAQNATPTEDNSMNNRPVETTIPETSTRPSLENPVPVPDNNANTPSQEMIEIEYNALLVKGNEKMSQENYTGAIADFEKAQELKATSEVARLIVECEGMEKEKEIIARKALYEPIMPFGNLVIVKKISNNRWGAIDNNGMERIRCEYLGANTAGNYRAFRRQDNLYDLFDANGDSKGSGVENY
jgi:serine/threonine-protein kinase